MTFQIFINMAAAKPTLAYFICPTFWKTFSVNFIWATYNCFLLYRIIFLDNFGLQCNTFNEGIVIKLPHHHQTRTLPMIKSKLNNPPSPTPQHPGSTTQPIDPCTNHAPTPCTAQSAQSGNIPIRPHPTGRHLIYTILLLHYCSNLHKIVVHTRVPHK